jgi:beta-N-acetylhexosaminidase
MRTFSPWVTQTLASLTLDEKLGQLLHPNVRPTVTPEEYRASLPPVRVGGMFIFTGSTEDFVRTAHLIQDGPGLPVVVSSDLESGAGRMIAGATSFPDLLAVGAADDEALARTMGEATAVEGRAYGVHWTFGPVVDINGHPGNPIANTRSLGDDTAKVTRMARALVAGMQAHGMAATVKHFPGDGWDDRDQHLVTSINPLTKDEWDRSSAVPYKETFADGCWTTMIGHIALPAVDGGDPTDPNGPPPAILSKKITTDLLRGELGFDGLVISDAIQMNGTLSRVRNTYDIVVKMINAGNDQLLFCEAKRDFEHLQKAVACGDITLARVDEACARVLELKEKLGFAADPASARPAADPAAVVAAHHARYSQAARGIADAALTLVKSDGSVPAKLSRGDKILVVHQRSNPEYHVDGVDDLLKAEGFVVDRHTEAESPYTLHDLDYDQYKLVLFLWNIGPTWGTNFIRPAGAWARSVWFVRQHQPKCPFVHVSFGTPYLVHDVPWADTMVNAYSPDVHTQAAVVDWLLGRQKATGVSPVDLDRPARVRDLIARAFAR